ncbi:cell envelope-like function transcriptional attenuator common domain protein [Aeromicrobium marinum DSM 15272]|uniref:Cell envelope-like function transcriptional attenuator common domain protein n=2 Tax=Aeromicrobium marinum TaxID=219314 RepID=E2SDT4_9ACTN|nr:cell envelope-like function transcriptional attenuator common domain protein [Aeromicrobium marinum DSM 15272]
MLILVGLQLLPHVEVAMPDDRSSRGSAAASATARIQFRRALTLTVMTMVMPGSAQLVLGNRQVGRIAVRVWLATIAALVLVLALAMVSRTGLFGLLTNGNVLTLVRWYLILGAVGWVLLLLDAWRLGTPLQLPRPHRLWMTGINGALCFATAAVMLFAAHLVSVQNAFIGTVFAATESSDATEGRYNVLLLGGDSGSDREGMRPDSLTVASIDADTGRTVLVGLPRNLEDVPFPEGSVMHEEFPDGFTCDDCYLNSVHTWATDHADLFPGSDDPGMDATVEAVEAVTGLTINYHAMVNMQGFAQLIDAVGGVTVDVKERTAIGGIGSPITGWIEAGTRELDGDEALWYSRSRVQNSDFSRMGRQKCVMNAMLQQLSPSKVLLNVEEIAASSEALLHTDIPAGELNTFMDLALKARQEPMSTVSLVPPLVYTGNPDYPTVRRLVDEAIAVAEGVEAPPALQTARLDLPSFDTPEQQAADPTLDNQSENLAETC